MRAILDANELVSYLLDPESRRTITIVVEAFYGEEIDLLVPAELFDEVRENVTRSNYLNKRISAAAVDLFEQTLLDVARVPRKLTEAFPEYTADPDDDYLVAYAVVHDIHYVATGDSHLPVHSCLRPGSKPIRRALASA